MNLPGLVMQAWICLAPLCIKIPESLLFYHIIFMELHGKVFPKKHSGYKARYAVIGRHGNRRVSIKNKNILLTAAEESLRDQARKAIRQSEVTCPSEFIG